MMLIINAEIMFLKPIGSSCSGDGLSVKNVLRPAFNFGEDLLFSGAIQGNELIEMYNYDTCYVVRVEFPTIEREAYQAVEPLIKRGMTLNIQTGSKIIGKATLLDYTYVLL